MEHTVPSSRMNICIIGYGCFGQFLHHIIPKHHNIIVMDRNGEEKSTSKLKILSLSDSNALFSANIDVFIFSVSISSLGCVLNQFQPDILAGKLVVEVCSVKMYPKRLMTSILPHNCDICCTHPMFGPNGAKHGVEGLSFMFERVRISDVCRCEQFLNIWREELGCIMVEISCEEHDEIAANSQFLTHLVGRVLGHCGVKSSPIDTPSFKTLLALTENICSDSDDMFCGMYVHNPFAAAVLQRMKESVMILEERLLTSEFNGTSNEKT